MSLVENAGCRRDVVINGGVLAFAIFLAQPVRASDDQGAILHAEPTGAPEVSESQHLLSDQFSFGSTPGSPALTKSAFISDRLSGSNDVTKTIGVLYSVAVTREFGAPASVGMRFPDRGGTILRLSGGSEWQASPHWAVIPTISGSLPSTSRTATTVPFHDANGALTSLAGDLRAKSSSLGFELSLELDSLEAIAPELLVTSTAGVVNYWSDQQLMKLQLANNSVVSSAALAQQCQTSGCSPEVLSLLQKQSSSVAQFYGELDITTVMRRTEVGLSGTLFGYSRDPSQLGYFGVASFARGPAMGDGVPLAPLRFSTQLHALQKLGRLRLAASAEYGNYVDDEGSTLTLSAKPAFDVTRGVRMWVTGTWQRQDLSGAGPAVAFIGALGLRWAY